MNYIYSIICFMLPPTVWLIIKRKKLDKNNHGLRHIIWVYIFLLYAYTAIVEAASVGTIWDVIYQRGIFPRINLIPFSGHLMVQYELNVFMFMPLGFLLPLIWENFRHMFKTVLTGFGMSLGIELLQLLNSRFSDVDDLLMNTLGALCGYMIWKVFKLIFPKAGNKATQVCDWEPVTLLLLSTFGVVFLYNWRLV